MNRVYLVASANMEAKVKEVMDAVAAAGMIAAAYKPCVNGAEAVKELKAHNSAVLMEKIAADFLQQDFDSVDAVVVEGATGMSDVMAQKFNDTLATALDAKIYSDGEDADLFCPCRLLACPKCLAADLAAEPAERKTSQALPPTSLPSPPNARRARPCSAPAFCSRLPRPRRGSCSPKVANRVPCRPRSS